MKYIVVKVEEESEDALLYDLENNWPGVMLAHGFTQEEMHLLWEALSWCVELEGWYDVPEPGEGPQHTVEQDDRVLEKMKDLVERNPD